MELRPERRTVIMLQCVHCSTIRRSCEPCSLIELLFEQSPVEQLRAAAFSLVLQAEEQIPEVYTRDALPGELP